jgi:hypothetical protein
MADAASISNHREPVRQAPHACSCRLSQFGRKRQAQIGSGLQRLSSKHFDCASRSNLLDDCGKNAHLPHSQCLHIRRFIEPHGPSRFASKSTTISCYRPLSAGTCRLMRRSLRTRLTASAVRQSMTRWCPGRERPHRVVLSLVEGRPYSLPRLFVHRRAPWAAAAVCPVLQLPAYAFGASVSPVDYERRAA